MAERQPGLRYAIIVVPERYRHELLSFRTDSSLGAAVGRLGDLSVKRNLGLLLGYRAGWRSLLFLDDDISGLDARLVRRAAAALAPGGAVGMPAYRFPDNSVVCHANRYSGHRQDVFVSGAALVVDCTRVDSFFPRVYNEDWLFLADAVNRRTVSKIGSVRQLKYDPYETTKRAKFEEFGDVLAEGLMSSLHCGDISAATRSTFWNEFLHRREEFIVSIVNRIEKRQRDRRKRAVLAALEVAEKRRSRISAGELATYVSDWRADLACWQGRIQGMSRGVPFAEILKRLRLGRVVVSPNFDVARTAAAITSSRGASWSWVPTASLWSGIDSFRRQQPIALDFESMLRYPVSLGAHVRSGDPSRQALLVAGGVGRERLPEPGAVEAEALIEPAGGVIAVDDPQPDPGDIQFAEAVESGGHQRGGQSGAAEVRMDPEVAQKALVLQGAFCGDAEETNRSAVENGDEPVAAADFVGPPLVRTLGLDLITG
jgi:hypothetical protein